MPKVGAKLLRTEGGEPPAGCGSSRNRLPGLERRLPVEAGRSLPGPKGQRNAGGLQCRQAAAVARASDASNRCGRGSKPFRADEAVVCAGKYCPYHQSAVNNCII